MSAPLGYWSYLPDSVTTSTDVARERLRRDVQVRTHAPVTASAHAGSRIGASL